MYFGAIHIFEQNGHIFGWNLLCKSSLNLLNKVSSCRRFNCLSYDTLHMVLLKSISQNCTTVVVHGGHFFRVVSCKGCPPRNCKQPFTTRHVSTPPPPKKKKKKKKNYIYIYFFFAIQCVPEKMKPRTIDVLS